MSDEIESGNGVIARPYTDEELAALLQRVHRTALAKGWWTVHPALKSVVFDDGDLEDKLVLIASELCEAFEEYRKPLVDITKVYTYKSDGSSTEILSYQPGTKPEGFPVEMADAYIRVLDLMGALKLMPESVALLDVARNWTKPGKHLFRILDRLVRTPDNPRQWLSYVLGYIEVACAELGVDLRAALALKADYNETRSTRHGGKRA